MTEAELKIIEAVSALNVPDHFIGRAATVLMCPEDTHQVLLAQLSTEVAAHFHVEGRALDACVTACIMLASLRLTGRLPPPPR